MRVWLTNPVVMLLETFKDLVSRTKHLLLADVFLQKHPEAWYQIELYGDVPDAAFMFDSNYVAKR